MPLYDEYLTQSELQRWILDADVFWTQVDPARALTAPAILDQVRDAALIESYFPLYTTRLLRASWNEVDLTAVFSIQLYESYKHFYALNRYLELVGYRPITDEDIVEIRRRALDRPVEDPVAELARYMISEHFAAYFFLRLSRQAPDAVLAQLAAFIAKDEFRHTQFAYDLLDVRLKADAVSALRDRPAGAEAPAYVRQEPPGSRRDRVLRAALDFRHVGADVVPSVPVSEKNDLPAILTLNRRLQRLCGISPAEFAKATVHGHD